MKGLLCYGKNKSKFLRSGERQRGRRMEAQKWLVWCTDKGIGVNMASGCLGAAKNACEKMGNVKCEMEGGGSISIQARQKGHTFRSHCVRFAVAAGAASVRYFHLVSCLPMKLPS